MNENYHIRNAKETDSVSVYEFVSGLSPLENYFEHVYKILLRYFGNSCFIAEKDEDIIGFVMGFKSQDDKNIFFIWQIGVDSDFQGQRIGSTLLKKVEKKAEEMNCKRIELTVDPENIPSQRLFQKCNYNNISEREGETVEISGNIAVKDYYKPGSHFTLFGKKIV